MMANGTDAELHVLHVEDNRGDVRLLAEVLRQAAPRLQLSVVPDGVEAMRFLRREGSYARAPRPHLMLLDLKLPRKNGLEVLAELKQDAALKSIPVIVLTSSAADRDLQQAYTLQANCYLTKPVDLDEYLKLARILSEFWFSVVKLPPPSNGAACLSEPEESTDKRPWKNQSKSC